VTGHLNFNMRTTIWWEPKRPNVIKICTGDPRFVNDEGGKPGLWIPVPLAAGPSPPQASLRRR